MELVQSFQSFFSNLFSRDFLKKQIIHIEKSLYEDILVIQERNKRSICFRNSAQQQSCIDLRAPHKLIHRYTQRLLAALFLNPEPQHILIIGLGAGILPTAFHILCPQAKIDIVEIDPAMVNVAKQFFSFNPHTPYFHLAIEDGRQFVKKARRIGYHYDLIILDAFTPEYIPPHMLTKEFLYEVQALLTPEGVLAANTFCSSKIIHHESATYQHVFGSYYQLSKDHRGNRIILAMPRNLPDKRKIINNALLFRENFKVLGVTPESLLSLFKLCSNIEKVEALSDSLP